MEKGKTSGALALSDVIARILTESGLSIAAFARKLGYSRRYVYFLLQKGDPTGSRKPPLNMLKKICDATGYSLTRLLADIGYIQRPQTGADPDSVIVVKGSGESRRYVLGEENALLLDELVKRLAKKE